MQGVVFQDILRAGSVLLACPAAERPWRLAALFAAAGARGVSLSDAAAGYRAGPPASLSNPDYCACLALVLQGLANRGSHAG